MYLCQHYFIRFFFISKRFIPTYLYANKNQTMDLFHTNSIINSVQYRCLITRMKFKSRRHEVMPDPFVNLPCEKEKNWILNLEILYR